MSILHFATICVIGFVGCAEFGSFAFVHPVLRRLPAEHWIDVEQGLLRTFGRVMPIGMTAAPILAASSARSLDGGAAVLAWVSTLALAIALITTIAVNVRINLVTGRWDRDDPPTDWREQRRRWERFQGIRAVLQLLGFVVVTAAVLSQ